MLDEKKSGHVTLDLSVHDIDFAQYVFGQPKSVSAVYHEMKDYSNFVSTNMLYDGFHVETVGGWYNAAIPFHAEYTAIFENGYVESRGGKVVKNGEEVSLEVKETSENTGINLSGADGYSDEIRYFMDCIKNNREPERVSPESSLRSVMLVEEILKKAQRV